LKVSSVMWPHNIYKVVVVKNHHFPLHGQH
jgi:hypothetical protein